jgi:hypothetical protein
MPAAVKMFGNRYHLDRTDPRIVQGGQFIESGRDRFCRALIATTLDLTINKMGPNATHPRIRLFATPRGVTAELRINTTEDVVFGLKWRLDNFSEGAFRSNLEMAIHHIMDSWLREDYKIAFVIGVDGLKRTNPDSEW